MKKAGQQKICPNGHIFYKSSDCPVCPLCEKEKKPAPEWMATCAAPARRALEARKITTLKQLSGWSESEILSWHGIGPATIPVLRKALRRAGLHFKK